MVTSERMVESMRTSLKEFKSAIETMKHGDVIYINAISCSVKMIDYLRKEIEFGRLIPDEETVKSMVKPDVIPSIMSGKKILPQCEYRKVV